MSRWIAIAALATLPGLAQAAEGVEISARSRTLAVAAAAANTPASQAPFSDQRDPFAQLFTPQAPLAAAPTSRCDRAGATLCYDLAERRVVYRPAREYMPRFQGMTAESVSLRHDRLVVRYSFR